MSTVDHKYTSSGRSKKQMRRLIAVFLFLSLMFRILTLNFPSLCPFIPSDPVDEASITLHSGKTEYSSFRLFTEIAPAMVKDSSESNEDAFEKSSKYPVLMIIFLALAKLITDPKTLSRLLAIFCVRGKSLRSHLSISILRI